MDSWDDLRYFRAVAECGSLNGARKKLGVNHSTVFRRIRGLEEKLGVRLFERRDARYHLTGAGEALMVRAEQVAQAIDEVDRLILGGDQTLEGTVRITCPDGFAYYELPPLLAEFQQHYPGIVVELLASSDDYNLSRMEADIALRATSEPPEHLVGRKLRTVPWYLYGRSDGLQADGGHLRLGDLAGRAVIGPDRSLLRLAPMQWLEKHADTFKVAARANSLMGMAAMARAGMGLALLPDDVAPDLIPLGEFERRFESPLWLLTHPDLRSNARVQACNRFLVDKMSR
ncbi:MAG: LysR family transcriptional regulator [Gammaproteobacteria bacterium]|nr:MAG: LysR family transcriptional regulator [Gammaproteobacteria bacterium]